MSNNTRPKRIDWLIIMVGLIGIALGPRLVHKMNIALSLLQGRQMRGGVHWVRSHPSEKSREKAKIY